MNQKVQLKKVLKVIKNNVKIKRFTIPVINKKVKKVKRPINTYSNKFLNAFKKGVRCFLQNL